MNLSEVSNILWRERQLLELLLFKLEEEQLVLTSSHSRWLAHATREVEMVMEELKAAELNRAIEVDVLAGQLGLEPGSSLKQLVEVVPAPWDRMFGEHRKAFLDMTSEIMILAQANRELLANGDRAAREALAWLSGVESVETYAPNANKSGVSSTTNPNRPHLVNKAV